MSNELHERILDAMHNIGGVVTPTMLQQRANIAKAPIVIENNLREMQQAGMVMPAPGGAGWLPAKAKPKPNGGEPARTTASAVKRRARRSSEEVKRLVYEYLADHTDATASELVREIHTGAETATRLLAQYKTENPYLYTRAPMNSADLKAAIRNLLVEYPEMSDCAIAKRTKQSLTDVITHARPIRIKLFGMRDKKLEQEGSSMNKNEINSDRVRESLKKLRAVNSPSPVENLEIKQETLNALGNLFDQSIADVLTSISEDLVKLESLAKE